MAKDEGAYYDADAGLEVFVDRDESPATVEVRLPSMVSLTPAAARRFGRAIVAAADIAAASTLDVERAAEAVMVCMDDQTVPLHLKETKR